MNMESLKNLLIFLLGCAALEVFVHCRQHLVEAVQETLTAIGRLMRGAIRNPVEWYQAVQREK